MRRLAIPLLLLILVACVAAPTVSLPRLGGTAAAVLPTATQTVPPPTPTEAAPTLPPEPSPTPAADFSVQVHPDGGLYLGDQVSIEVITPTGYDPHDKSVEISADGQRIGTATFSPFGIGGRQQATFTWAWDTAALEPGSHDLDFSVLPDGPTWSETLTLLPAADLPAPGADANWATVTTECCTINYISGTEAGRDIATLEQEADAQALDVEQKLGATLDEKIPVVFMSRVLGHGGFTNEAIYVSYLDRNYAGNATAQVLHHEMVHWFDGKLGGELRPTILVEGLAVYLSGGHFKPEALPPRAAALLNLDWYIPLRELSDDFYPSQHEIGYIEAGALIQYLVETYGWEAFNAFYRDMRPQASGKQSDAMDTALKSHFGIGLEQLEAQWLDSLRALPPDPAARQDVVLSVQFYDTVRRYQQLFDPSAYFQTAWLPDGAQMREKGITADFLRHPNAPLNVFLETLLVQADASLLASDYESTAQTLKTVRLMLDSLKNETSGYAK
jgi:hypothetical protein